METMISYCGLDCESCPIHRATLEQDPLSQQRMREEIARICRQQYAMELSLAEISDCDGCCSDSGRLFSGCAKCTIRACARDRKLTSCAYCPDYACSHLLELFRTDPAARTRLELLRKTSQ